MDQIFELILRHIRHLVIQIRIAEFIHDSRDERLTASLSNVIPESFVRSINLTHLSATIELQNFEFSSWLGTADSPPVKEFLINTGICRSMLTLQDTYRNSYALAILTLFTKLCQNL